MSQSLERALDVLGLVAEGTDTLDALAERIGVHKTTVLRLLRVFEVRGYVTRDSGRRYRLGPTVFGFAQLGPDTSAVRAAAAVPLRDLGAQTGQTVHLAAYQDGVVVYIDKIESRQTLRMYSRIGVAAALHATAVAKVLLGGLDETERERVVGGIPLTRLTGNTITAPDALLAEIRLSAARGWAVDREEHETFMNCIGAPVHGADGRVAAAVSVSAPNVVLSYEELLGLLPALRDAVGRISAELGHRGEQVFQLPPSILKEIP